ncbi:MAG: hypothetical protein IT430_03555 [Phycisphaerales bacterium]|nr:hypothetical protein [Phycisphaerales bacterium]
MADDIHLALLDQIKVASPCPVPWESMTGDDTTRFCGECSLHVHNLSAMSRGQAEAFLQQHRHDDRVCATFFRRTDGTILTQDCPVGLAAIRARARRAAGRAVAAMFALLGVSLTIPGCNGYGMTGGVICIDEEESESGQPSDAPDEPAAEELDQHSSGPAGEEGAYLTGRILITRPQPPRN